MLDFLDFDDDDEPVVNPEAEQRLKDWEIQQQQTVSAKLARKHLSVKKPLSKGQAAIAAQAMKEANAKKLIAAVGEENVGLRFDKEGVEGLYALTASGNYEDHLRSHEATGNLTAQEHIDIKKKL